MPQSLVQLYTHIVFSTKNRLPYLVDGVVRDRMHAYLVGICKNQDCPALAVGGTADHVHLFCSLGKTSRLADLVRDLKRDSSSWIKAEHPKIADFHWQNGYGGFSVSPSHATQLIPYIRTQMEHHAIESFQDEFRRLCKKYELPLDERYVWD